MVSLTTLTQIFQPRSPTSVAQAMTYRQLGKTSLWLSAVGFGTCQLRLVPKHQALETLHAGFNLGVNFVHTAPDYEGAENIVAQAVQESSHQVYVCSQAYDVHGNSDGYVDHFERLFESTCERFGRSKLELFGIACIDDREAFGENVWGPKGMMDFLQRKKQEGRVEAIFCTTHGSPDYIQTLLDRNIFDALMIAYNVLGFHLLSYSPPPERHFEHIPSVPEKIFSLAQKKGTGLMIMKPFAGGLLCQSKAFPPRAEIVDHPLKLDAKVILRSILAHEAVSCVVPGTASVEEAINNAQSGYLEREESAEQNAELQQYVHYLQSNLCSRCGYCDQLCSQNLSVSWLFRSSYIALFPSETFETWDEVAYFNLHPQTRAVCASCEAVTCKCPYGIDIPKSLVKLHQHMSELKAKGHVEHPNQVPIQFDPGFSARVVLHDIPEVLCRSKPQVCRLYVENTGNRGWFVDARQFAKATVKLLIFLNNHRVGEVGLRSDVNCHERTHFVFSIRVRRWYRNCHLRLVLVAEHLDFSLSSGLVLYDEIVRVESSKKLPTKRLSPSSDYET